MAEAARRLYIHRNTLMYRLDKVFSLTGLDLRNFKDAVKMEIYFTLNGLF
jgi:carbohydrate diacid regulator